MKLSNYSLYFFTFLVGATTYLDVNLIARVPTAELLAFSSIPFLLSNRHLATIEGWFQLYFCL